VRDPFGQFRRFAREEAAMVFGHAKTFGNAVREGASRRPQARYAHRSGLNGGTDAIGAAADAVGELERLLKTQDYGPLQKRWPVLTLRVRHPLRKEIALVQSIVHSLNDQYGWTREAVAAFVDGLDVAVESRPRLDAPPVMLPRARKAARSSRR
jgi:hypothetical protein